MDTNFGTNTRMMRMGEGKVVIAHGLVEGLPSLILAPAKEPGVRGTPADSEKNANGGFDDAIILQFTSMDAVMQHLNQLSDLMRATEARTNALFNETTK